MYNPWQDPCLSEAEQGNRLRWWTLLAYVATFGLGLLTAYAVALGAGDG